MYVRRLKSDAFDLRRRDTIQRLHSRSLLRSKWNEAGVCECRRHEAGYIQISFPWKSQGPCDNGSWPWVQVLRPVGQTSMQSKLQGYPCPCSSHVEFYKDIPFASALWKCRTMVMYLKICICEALHAGYPDVTGVFFLTREVALSMIKP